MSTASNREQLKEVTGIREHDIDVLPCEAAIIDGGVSLSPMHAQIRAKDAPPVAPEMKDGKDEMKDAKSEERNVTPPPPLVHHDVGTESAAAPSSDKTKTSRSRSDAPLRSAPIGTPVPINVQTCSCSAGCEQGSSCPTTTTTTTPATKVTRSQTTETSLYERLGGRTGIEKCVPQIVDKHMSSPIIGARYKNSDRDKLTAKVVKFMTKITGGPSFRADANVEVEHDMSKVHHAMNIQPNEFVEVIDDTVSTLEENGVGDQEVAEVLLLFWRYKNQIVGK